MALMDAFRQVRRADESRSGLPGEHWATFGTALAVMRWAGARRSVSVRMLGMTAGVVLMARALSGRDGPLARWRTARSSR